MKTISLKKLIQLIESIPTEYQEEESDDLDRGGKIFKEKLLARLEII